MRNFRPAVSVLAFSIALIGPEVVFAQQATGAIEEMVVTAQRREQKLSEVPMSISAFGEKDIEQRSITSFTDYASSVPSVTFTESGGFGNELKIRGIGAGTVALSPTVAVYMGDVPVIHTPRNAGASYDFRVVDLQRIEVLNGPQGQLYGSNSLGGAVKYVPNKPKTNKFSGSVTIGAAHVEKGNADHNLDVVLNVPLSSNLAMRLVGYDARMGGYYDDRFNGGPAIGSLFPPPTPFPGPPPGPPGSPGFGAWANAFRTFVFGQAGASLSPQQAAYRAPANNKENANQTDIHGGRLHLDLRATDDLQIELMVASERKKWSGSSFAEYNPPFTDVNNFQFYDVADSPGKDAMDLANLLVNYDFGSAVLTSSTSYTKRKSHLANDFSGVPAFFGNANVVPMDSSKFDEPKTWTQEFRLTSQGKGPFQWLAGLFYSKTNQDFRLQLTDLSGLNITATAFNAANTAGALPGQVWVPTFNLGSIDGRFTEKQTAIFGEVKYDVLPTLNAAYSFRSFLLQQTANQTQSGTFFNVANAAGVFEPFSTSSTNSERIFTPKYQLTWTPEKGSMFYATAAKGFRTGVTNIPVPPSLCAPFLPNGVSNSKSDTLWNYELGTSLALAKNRVQVNAAVYRVDWKDMQASFFPDPSGQQCPFSVIGNVADAQSKGFELKVSAKLTDQLSTDFTGSYNDIKYKTDAPLVGAKAGDTVQMSPRFQTNVGVQYEYKLMNMPSFARLDWNYVGEMQAAPTDFPSTAPAGFPPGPFVPHPKPAIGSYNVFNARIGWHLMDNLSLDLYGRNLTDKRGVTFAQDLGGAAMPLISYIRPRTLGAEMRLEF